MPVNSKMSKWKLWTEKWTWVKFATDQGQEGHNKLNRPTLSYGNKEPGKREEKDVQRMVETVPNEDVEEMCISETMANPSHRYNLRKVL